MSEKSQEQDRSRWQTWSLPLDAVQYWADRTPEDQLAVLGKTRADFDQLAPDDRIVTALDAAYGPGNWSKEVVPDKPDPNSITYPHTTTPDGRPILNPPTLEITHAPLPPTES
jgi:hypothetical protein